jgi:hypothetical protein
MEWTEPLRSNPGQAEPIAQYFFKISTTAGTGQHPASIPTWITTSLYRPDQAKVRPCRYSSKTLHLSGTYIFTYAQWALAACSLPVCTYVLHSGHLQPLLLLFLLPHHHFPSLQFPLSTTSTSNLDYARMRKPLFVLFFFLYNSLSPVLKAQRNMVTFVVDPCNVKRKGKVQ